MFLLQSYTSHLSACWVPLQDLKVSILVCRGRDFRPLRLLKTILNELVKHKVLHMHNLRFLPEFSVSEAPLICNMNQPDLPWACACLYLSILCVEGHWWNDALFRTRNRRHIPSSLPLLFARGTSLQPPWTRVILQKADSFCATHTHRAMRSARILRWFLSTLNPRCAHILTLFCNSKQVRSQQVCAATLLILCTALSYNCALISEIYKYMHVHGDKLKQMVAWDR